jgi:hypothetical protein
VEPYSIDDYITDKELALGINWVIEKNFDQEHGDSEPIYIPYEKILTFIEGAAQSIISRLSDGVMFPRIF